jgi:ribonuclease HII
MQNKESRLLAFYTPDGKEAGLDEAGRGCLAGPVVAAAVILPKDFYHPLLTDSKKLTAKQRETLIEVIKTSAIDYAIAEVDHTKIDEINIYKASVLAMHLAVDLSLIHI